MNKEKILHSIIDFSILFGGIILFIVSLVLILLRNGYYTVSLSIGIPVSLLFIFSGIKLRKLEKGVEFKNSNKINGLFVHLALLIIVISSIWFKSTALNVLGTCSVLILIIMPSIIETWGEE